MVADVIVALSSLRPTRLSQGVAAAAAARKTRTLPTMGILLAARRGTAAGV
jgi:hypothetical protein